MIFASSTGFKKPFEQAGGKTETPIFGKAQAGYRLEKPGLRIVSPYRPPLLAGPSEACESAGVR